MGVVQVNLYDAASGKVACTLQGHTDRVNVMDWNATMGENIISSAGEPAPVS